MCESRWAETTKEGDREKLLEVLLFDHRVQVFSFRALGYSGFRDSFGVWSKYSAEPEVFVPKSLGAPHQMRRLAVSAQFGLPELEFARRHYMYSGRHMSFVLRPWQLLLMALAGWINQNQQQVVEFQNAQIQVLLTRLGKKRLLLERRRAPPLGGEWQGAGPKDAPANYYDRHSRHDLALAPPSRGPEMGLQWPAAEEARPAAYDGGNNRLGTTDGSG